MMDSLENLTIRPDLRLEGLAVGDLLSRVLSQIRLTGDRVYSLDLDVGKSVDLESNSAHVCIVQRGSVLIRRSDQEEVLIESGGIVLLPHDPTVLNLTVTDSMTMVVCRFWFDASSFQSMLFALPWLLYIKKAEASTWAEGILSFILLEASDTQPGGALMVSRLIDLIVIRILRAWVQQGSATGWLGGLSDLRIARVLREIHENPGRQWRIESLAEIAGMSRSAFSERFRALVGRSPLRYQNEWRLTLARTMLLERNSRIGEVGFFIGYESEAAFSRAYKTFWGRSPRDDQNSQVVVVE